MSEGLLEKTKRTEIGPSVDTLNQIMSAPPEQTRDILDKTCQELLADKVGERIVDQVDLLAGMYRERSVGEVYQNTTTIDEYTQFATRTADCKQLEEIYTVNDSYSTANHKNYRLRSVAVDLFLGGRRQQIQISPTYEVKVYQYDDAGEAHYLSGEAADQIVGDFFYRSLISGAKMQARTAAERDEANTDALAKLNALHASLEASMSGVSHVDSPEARQRRHRIYIGQA